MVKFNLKSYEFEMIPIIEDYPCNVCYILNHYEVIFRQKDCDSKTNIFNIKTRKIKNVEIEKKEGDFIDICLTRKYENFKFEYYYNIFDEINEKTLKNMIYPIKNKIFYFLMVYKKLKNKNFRKTNVRLFIKIMKYIT